MAQLQDLVETLGSEQAVLYYLVHTLKWPPLDANEYVAFVLHGEEDVVTKDWDPTLHPRDTHGRFIRKFARVKLGDEYGYIDDVFSSDEVSFTDELSGNFRTVSPRELVIVDDHDDPILRHMFEKRVELDTLSNEVDVAQRELMRALDDPQRWENPDAPETPEVKLARERIQDAERAYLRARPTAEELNQFVPHLQPLWDQYELGTRLRPGTLATDTPLDHDAARAGDVISQALETLGFRQSGMVGNNLEASALFDRRNERDWIVANWRYGTSVPDSQNLERAVHELQLVPDNVHISRGDPETNTIARAAWLRKEETYKQIAQDIYDQAQRVLITGGIEHVHLYRGVTEPATPQQAEHPPFEDWNPDGPSEPGPPPEAGPPIQQHATLTSWTTEEIDAQEFASGQFTGYHGDRSLVFEADVPRERIFGLPGQLGFLGVPNVGPDGDRLHHVNEFVVLGGPELPLEPAHEWVYGYQVKTRKPYDPKLHPRDPHTGRFITVRLSSHFGDGPSWDAVARKFDHDVLTTFNKLLTDAGRKYGVRPQIKTVAMYDREQEVDARSQGILAEYHEDEELMYIMPEMVVGLLAATAPATIDPPGYTKDDRDQAVHLGTEGVFAMTHELFHSFNAYPQVDFQHATRADENLEEALTQEVAARHIKDFARALLPPRNDHERRLQDRSLEFFDENTYTDERERLFVAISGVDAPQDQVINELKFTVPPDQRVAWIASHTNHTEDDVRNILTPRAIRDPLDLDPAGEFYLHQKFVPPMPEDGVRIAGGGRADYWSTWEQAADNLLQLRALGITDVRATQGRDGRNPLTPEQQSYLVDLAARRLNNVPELMLLQEDNLV